MEKKQARHKSRIIALEALFFYLAREESVEWTECHRTVCEEEGRGEDEFSRDLLQKSVENLGKIKVIIRAYAPDYTFEKIAPINRTLLILGLVEMKFLGTPPIVVINEYIELAKEFGESRSAAFVNGVLDAFRKNIGMEREEPKEDHQEQKKSKRGE